MRDLPWYSLKPSRQSLKPTGSHYFITLLYCCHCEWGLTVIKMLCFWFLVVDVPTVPPGLHQGVGHCLLSHCYLMPCVVTRGVLLIQSERARAPSDFGVKWNLNTASKRQNIGDSYFLYLIQSYQHDWIIQSCEIQICVGWLVLSQRQKRLYSSAHYNQSHTMLLNL